VAERQLFWDRPWRELESQIESQLGSEIRRIETDRVLGTSLDALADDFVDKFRFDIPALLREEIRSEPPTEILREEFPGQRGTRVELTVPFSGDANLFAVTPTSFNSNPPRGKLSHSDNTITLIFEGMHLAGQSEMVQRDFDQKIRLIEQYLEWLGSDLTRFNDKLPALVRGILDTRYEKLRTDRELVASLKYPIRERPGVAGTYVAPIRRKVAPTVPPTATPFEPEPVLATQDYENILTALNSMALVMERSPTAFKGMNEETLRTLFLVPLNGIYEGEATGETFNYQGKTDILIRSKDRNIFIAECAFWKGPAALTEKLDQLLGYSSWRDTKVAVLIFNLNKDFSRVLDAIQNTVPKHTNWKRTVGRLSETSFRYNFTQRDDPNREMVLTVLAFDVPS